MMTGSNLVCGTCLNKLRQTQFGNWIKSMSCSEGIDAAFSCWFFDDELQQVIHLLKYSDYAGVGTQLGKLMGKTIQVDNIREIDMLIPIPLHTVKKRKRGYNQADFIAKGLSTSWNCPVRTDVLRRTKFTESQTQLNKQERIQNLADAIVVRRNVKDKTIVLIDDVLTTGSTMSSAAIALKKCGTKKVIALTCATPRPTEKT
jgi:ComF family protein